MYDGMTLNKLMLGGRDVNIKYNVKYQNYDFFDVLYIKKFLSFQSARWLSCWSMRLKHSMSRGDRCEWVGRSNLILTTKSCLAKGH